VDIYPNPQHPPKSFSQQQREFLQGSLAHSLDDNLTVTCDAVRENCCFTELGNRKYEL
jgi:hypothetical protein